jgi:L-lactate utilization protein LutB
MNIMTIEKERDALKLEAEQLRGQCKEVVALKIDKDGLILEAKRQAANIMALEEERDPLKLEAEQLRGQSKDAAALKEQRDNLF